MVPEANPELGVDITNTLIEQMKQWQNICIKCTWCKQLQFKNNYCVYCGHDLRIDWNKRSGIYIKGYVDKEGFI